jgi:hypothetical protein
MNKYIISLVIASVFLVGTPFAVNQASAADMSIRDFVNLLVAIGVITPDRMPAVNAYLATLDNNQVTPALKQIGYIKKVYIINGINYLDIDYVQWLKEYPNKDCTSKGLDAPNGYCTINENPLIRTFPIADNVIVKMQTLSHKTSGSDAGNYNYNQVISLAEFSGILKGVYDGRLPPGSSFDKKLYWIQLDNGNITEITEQYQP